ncbi:MAG: ubiquinol-cytochrome c reductase iron-sulfur subunit [Gammaproteobacteria bacterium]|nr:ubiquinol-cytochrome c reductase iron-sulfur subunit [Gammaproteobacteria bacterium]NIR82283.1 ubiquinol-cytochrome c reductase iron-sulfur subunit [Gammaproteobacteria bacterium]NIR91214.1 ubiquinol-cytochrome c reductase iron-sulfur subunit [Gammaproteobacteria bacterium]NIU03432.1 ubiquinol-cytochrome c reductase iron-sulfur subunit [Gammaproteobacteria bacterium]NIX84707.1 ubiquinol-cytochrome c reductase iron-sulfur subunit [Gammaproteobacteria bacterium]
MANEGVDRRRRRFLTAATSVVGAVGAAFVAVPFVASWQPSARARAIGAPIEVDISKLEPGQRLIEKWRGKPVWILRRTEGQLATLNQVEDRLRDPNSEVISQQPSYAQNEYRSIEPDLFVVIGICTHLGCSPLYLRSDEGATHGLGAEWPGGFFCPCHGSLFDISGRVFQGVPAPTNLEVPPYHYLSHNVIEVGVGPREA